LWDRINSTHKQQKMPPSGSHPAKFGDLCKSQQEIGWDQLFHGRLSCSWGQAFESATTDNNSEIKVGRPQWIAEVAVTTWRHVPQLWGSRNVDHHGWSQAEKEKKEQQNLQHRLKACAHCKSDSHQWLWPMHSTSQWPIAWCNPLLTCNAGFPSAAHALKNR